MTDKRSTARGLAEQALRDGAPTRWFEELYALGPEAVPWADGSPSPTLVRLLPSLDVSGRRVLVVGCGYGDDAVALADAGAVVTAFDVAPTAVAACRRRFPSYEIDWRVADVLEPDPSWGYELVVEINTLQVLPPAERACAAATLRSWVAPGGALLVIARGREPAEPEGAMPWPLTVAEVEALASDGLVLERFADVLDEEDPPVRRLVALLRRPGR